MAAAAIKPTMIVCQVMILPRRRSGILRPVVAFDNHIRPPDAFATCLSYTRSRRFSMFGQRIGILDSLSGLRGFYLQVNATAGRRTHRAFQGHLLIVRRRPPRRNRRLQDRYRRDRYTCHPRCRDRRRHTEKRCSGNDIGPRSIGRTYMGFRRRSLQD